MFLGGIIDVVLSPWHVLGNVRMTAQSYIDFLKARVEPLFKKKTTIFRKFIFMYNNTVTFDKNVMNL